MRDLLDRRKSTPDCPDSSASDEKANSSTSKSVENMEITKLPVARLEVIHAAYFECNALRVPKSVERSEASLNHFAKDREQSCNLAQKRRVHRQEP